MKIVYLSQVDLTRNYSGTVHIKEVVRGFLGKGAEIWLFCQRRGNFLYGEPGLHVIELGSIKGSFLDYFAYQIRLAYMLLMLCVKKEDIELMYIRSEAAMFAHLLIKMVMKKRYVLEFNSWPFRDIAKVRSISPIELHVIKILTYLSIMMASSVICVTDTLATRIKTSYPFASRKTFAVQNGANVELFSPMSQEKSRETLGIGLDEFILCYVAYFQYYNDIELIIKALPTLLESIPNLRLYLVGGWAQKDRLTNVKEMVRSLNLEDTVVFVGETKYEQIPLYICASDICCATFNQDVGDGSVMKVFEYLSCERPVIGTGISSLSFLKWNNCGENIPMRSTRNFIECVFHFYKNPYLMRKLGQNGRSMVVENFSWGKTIEKIWDIVDSR